MVTYPLGDNYKLLANAFTSAFIHNKICWKEITRRCKVIWIWAGKLIWKNWQTKWMGNLVNQRVKFICLSVKSKNRSALWRAESSKYRLRNQCHACIVKSRHLLFPAFGLNEVFYQSKMQTNFLYHYSFTEFDVWRIKWNHYDNHL